MEALNYLIKVDLLLILFFGTYRVVLARESLFMARRLWLLGGLLLAFVIPVLPLPTGPSTLFTYTLPVFLAHTDMGSDQGKWHPLALVVAMHLTISALLLARKVLSYHSALMISREHGSEEAFSFFGRVFVPEGGNERDRLAILTHEQVHAQQGHSFDLLFLELLAALNWSFPFWKYVRHELRLVHEHLADEQALRVHPAYQTLLVASSVGVPVHELIDHFHSNTLKQRIEMMNRPPSPQHAWTRSLVAVPVLLLALVLVSWQAVPFRPDGQDPVLTAEKMPEYTGGQEAMMNYMGANLVYPEAAKKSGAEGLVVVSFVVDKNGKVKNTKVEKGVSSELDKESMRVVAAMPDWRPGMNKGKAVDVVMKLPVRWVLPAE